MLTTKDAQTLRFELMAREYVQRIGVRLRERREALGLSQREVADQLPGAVQGNDISRYERGEHKPSDERLEQLAEALQTTVAGLLSDPPDKSVTPDLPFADQPALDDLRTELTQMRVDLAQVLSALDEFRALLQQRLSPPAEAEGVSRRRMPKPPPGPQLGRASDERPKRRRKAS